MNKKKINKNKTKAHLRKCNVYKLSLNFLWIEKSGSISIYSSVQYCSWLEAVATSAEWMDPIVLMLTCHCTTTSHFYDLFQILNCT